MSKPTEHKIKLMKLYSQVGRIYNELKEIGYDTDDCPLAVEDVNKFDQYHYFGTKAIDEAINLLALQRGQVVLDVGSGLGGPARYLASNTKCHVVAVELQEDLHQTALDLTSRCGLADNVRHVHADFLTGDIGADNVDAITSWLVFLHIKQKADVFNKCTRLLKPGGKLYIEDIFIEGDPSEDEKTIMRQLFFTLDTKEQYLKHMTEAGFTNIEFDDVTSKWKSFVTSRSRDYRSDRERHVRVHGETVYAEQQEFFDQIATLFTNGIARGCCITAAI